MGFVNVKRGLIIAGLLVIVATSIASASPARPDHAKGAIDKLKTHTKIRLMTYNIRHGKGEDGKVNLERIADTIRDSGADVVALQEVDRFFPRSGMTDEVAHLAALLNMESAFSPSLDLIVGQYGNAVLSRYPIVSRDVKFLSSPKERRSLLTVVVQVGKNRFTVHNTHLGLSGEEREHQMGVIVKVLSESQGPAVLVGDMNMRPGNALFSLLPQTFRRVALPAGSVTFHGGGEIDAIFANVPTVDGRVGWVVESDGSDHDAVVADLSLE
jgi:endonuclease/exonuclease/phosphatase family metal-dependent hydrolase